ncbi:serine hydrolase domain-containing protein [Streptomyces sp. CRN 30]|uniref:serine hydrolase domain-containing protein n=1 Tax=Streptomyces sp. CRN 30 TaxID=3075613 RepID=UPI002A8034BC|nr:serine hydrolase domain-containing protein [Streptomyces sp. CRN 30]
MRSARPSTNSRPRRGKLSPAAAASTAVLSLAIAAIPAQAAQAAPPPGVPAVSLGQGHGHGLDHEALGKSLEAFHEAGMHGAYSAVRDGSARWRGAAGVADVDTGRPVRPDFEHRIGSVTKTFTSVAVLQQVQRGRVDLDAPIGRYLPGLVPGEGGREVTVRMLLNHTSGLGDYDLDAFPGLLVNPAKALDEARFRHREPEKLVRTGLAAEPEAERGSFGYANTNYIIAGLLLRKVTGQDPEEYITREVIRKAGLRHTYFPRTPRLSGPHARMYESMYGLIDPARDYSVYDMSWAGTAGGLVSTMQDLNDFYRQLLGGELLGPDELRAMRTTVPVPGSAPGGEAGVRYGLGILSQELSGRRYWGHDGIVWGAGTMALSSEDGSRQVALGYNMTKYERFDENGAWLPDPIGAARVNHVYGALTGTFPLHPADPADPAAPSTPSAPSTQQRRQLPGLPAVSSPAAAPERIHR